MFANAYQSGCITVLYSCGSNPLALWDKQVKNGHIRRIVDGEVKSLVLEVSGTNVATTYITCPIKPRASLGIKLPFLVMIIKNMKKYFSFEVQVLDDKDMHRRFRVSNFQSTTKVRPFCTTMPIGLSDGWNQIQFNLADFTKRAYGSTYLETTRVQVHANVRIRRIYFSDMLYGEDEVPNEFKMFAKVKKKGAAPKAEERKEEIVPELEVPKPPSLHEAMPSPEEALPSPEEAPPSPEPSPEEEQPVEEEVPAPIEEVKEEEAPAEEEETKEEEKTEVEVTVEETPEPLGEEPAQEAAPEAETAQEAAPEAETEPATETVEATTTEVTEEVTTTEVATTEEPTTTEVGETTEEPTTDGQE